MPGGKTKFQAKWLEKMDSNNEIISTWCIKSKNEWEAFCKICNCSVSIANGGFSQLLQHSSRKKHRAAQKQRKGQTNLSIAKYTDEAAMSSSEVLKIFQPAPITIPKHVTRAEAIWAMKVAVSNYSFSSCSNIVPLFRLMFPENEIAKNMTLGDRKISYVLTHGLGPYFQEEMLIDLCAAVSLGSFFTVAFDEATTNQIQKQLDIFVRFWSPKFDEIICGYLTSLFFGHATAENIANGILAVLEKNKLPLSKVLMLSMDGPNLNLAVAKKLNNELFNMDSPALFNLGTCTLHKVHNCFSKALDKIPLDIDEFATDLFGFFKMSAARREDLINLEKLLNCEQKFLLRHVNSRWLTLGPVVDRILDLYSVLKEYFLKVLPKTKSSWRNLQNNARFKRIAATLNDPLTLVYLNFVSAIFPSLQEYLNLFQGEAPLVHLMYSKINSLVRSVMLRVLKDAVVGNKEGKDLQSISIEDFENYRPLKDLNIGEGTQRAFLSVKDNTAKEARMAIRSFLITLSKLLKEVLPLADVFLKDLEFLHPAVRDVKSEKTIRRVCAQLKPLKLGIDYIDKIVHEWIIYKFDSDVIKLAEKFCNSDRNHRIDHYWKDVLDIKDIVSGEKKFSNLGILVKNCLSLAHGNADVERGFSLNNSIVTVNRASLSQASIIAIRHVKDAVKRHGDICCIPITDKMLTSITKSHSKYMAAKEAEKKEAEEIKRKRTIEEEEEKEAIKAKKLKREKEEKIKETEEKIKYLQEDLLSAQNCLTEGNERLQKALKKKDMNDMRIASTLIDAATLKVKEITKLLNETQEKKFKLQCEKAR